MPITSQLDKYKIAPQTIIPTVTQPINTPTVANTKTVAKVQPVVKPITKSVTKPAVKKTASKPLSIDQQIIQTGNGSISEAQKARDVIIKARLKEQLGEQAGMERDVTTGYVKAQEQIQGDVYDAQETQKANGVQRGIQYSQQQQALEQGISRAGMKMIVDAGKDRDGALLKIKERIASLKSGASAELQASQSQASSEKYQLAFGEAQKKQAWAREDAVQARAFANQLKLEGVSQANRMAMAKFDKQTQLELSQSKNKADNEMFAKEIARQTAMDKNAKLIENIKNSPGFNMYPKLGTPGYKAEVKKLTEFYTLQGFTTKEAQAIIAKNAGTVMSGVGSGAGNKSNPFNWQKKLTTEQIINRN